MFDRCTEWWLPMIVTLASDIIQTVFFPDNDFKFLTDFRIGFIYKLQCKLKDIQDMDRSQLSEMLSQLNIIIAANEKLKMISR